MNYIDFYNTNIVGYYPGKEASLKTACTIEYLIDNGFEPNLLQILLETGKEESYRPQDIPDALWNNSLIERGKYYMHKELQITPPPPRIDSQGKEIPSDFFVEMKIKYTTKDILEYFYKAFNTKESFKEDKRFQGQIDALYRKYKRFENVEALDIILAAIDWNSQSNKMIIEPFGIDDTDTIVSVYQNLNEKRLNGKGKITWRTRPITLSLEAS